MKGQLCHENRKGMAVVENPLTCVGSTGIYLPTQAGRLHTEFFHRSVWRVRVELVVLGNRDMLTPSE